MPADSVAVYKCDFGDIHILNTDDLRPLPSEFRQIPQLAIPVNLHGTEKENPMKIQNLLTKFPFSKKVFNRRITFGIMMIPHFSKN